jgi:exonuclease SbcC
MQAFGPYSDTCLIDFRRIAAGGLFLIHGQTGAGKTSILDGLCFALFGSSSGAERSGRGMRCDLAPAATATEVSLVFALGSRIYKINRRPAQEIARLRGTGTRSIVAEADLFALEGDCADFASVELDAATWTPLSSGEKKTSAKVIELLGMTDDQFRQVVVLPQGQFRRFLTSGSEERERILETLFRTSRFRAFTRLLAEQAAELRQRIQESRQKLEGLFSSLGVANETEIETKTQELAIEISALDKDIVEIEGRYNEAFVRREKSREARRLQLELATCESQSKLLDQRAPQVEMGRERLMTEKRARPALFLDESTTKLGQEIARLKSEVSAETTRLHAAMEAEKEWALKSVRLAERKPEMENAAGEIATLRVHYENARRLEGALNKIRECATRLSEARTLKDASEKKLATLKSAIAGAGEKLLALTAASGRIDGLKAEADALKKLVVDLESVMKLTIEVRSLTTSRSATELEIRTLRQELESHQTLRRSRQMAFYLAQAAILAAELKNEEACPVCGSVEHPRPARLATDAPSQNELDSLEREASAREKKLAERERELASLGAKLDAFSAEITRALGPHEGASHEIATQRWHEATAEFKRKAEAIKVAEDSVRQLEITRREVEERQTQLIQAEADLKSVETRYLQISREHDNAVTSRNEIEFAIPENLRDLKAIEAKGRALKLMIDSHQTETKAVDEALATATKTLASSRGRIETQSRLLDEKNADSQRLKEELEQLLLASGFSDLTSLRAARLDEETIERLELEITSFANERAVVTARESELRSGLSGLPSWSFDENEIEAVFLSVDRERSDLREKKGALLEKFNAFSDARERLGAVNHQTTQIEKRYAVIGKLAAVANGQPPDNLTRVNFPRFVLAAELDEVLEQASRRLEVMSRGRFILKRAQEIDDKRRNAGLDLTIEDSFTGTSRPAAYLSGGESFLASLALALGLADVVQSTLGGVRLEAVFVDEGFGTLDPETLELAMKVLSDLQVGGRIVGVISHVPELREQISERLVVRKSPTGSTTEWERP